MDPLSVASGVAGLVTLADVVISRTYNTIIACKHASGDSRKLLREAQALLGILQGLASLETKLGAATLTSQIPAAQVLACQQTLQNIRDKLEKSDPKEDGISVFQKAKRTLKWPLSASETEKFLSEMERHKSTFDLALSADALNAILSSQLTGQKTDAKIDGIANSVNRLCKIENTQEDRRILQMIGAEDADDTYQANLKLHQHGTGLWFLEEGKPFSTWLSTPGSKLWVYGIPGAGKTILSVLAISKTAELMSSTHGVIFYYCSHRNEESRRSTGILRCLVGQLARQNRRCMNMLEAKFKHHEHTSAQTWTRDDKELEMMLRKMIRQFGSVSIVIDGVDECHEAAAVTDTLTSLASETSGVRTLIFSRKEADLVPFLEDYVQMSIAAESQDLRLFVPAEIESRTRFRKLRIKDPSVKDEIIETLVTGADGMFRWVVCQLDHLCDLTTDDERLSALKQLPRTLESTYDRILERVVARGESICNLVQRSLIWIIRSSVTTQQLCEAVCIDPHATSLDSRKLIDAEDILISCSSLVRVSADGQRLESAHFTVVEYLKGIDQDTRPHLTRFRTEEDEDAVNSYMAETCLTALTLDNITTNATRDSASSIRWLRQFPFYWHAAQFWYEYESCCQPTASIVALTTKLFLVSTSDHYQVWAHVYILTWRYWGRDESRHVANQLGNDATTGNEQFENYVAPVQWDSEWTKALATVATWGKLHFAALLHQEHILRDLLDSSEKLNDVGAVGTPLQFAMLGITAVGTRVMGYDILEMYDKTQRWFRRYASKMSSLTVKTLIKLGADINVKYPLPGGRDVTTVLIACMTGHYEEAFAAGATLDEFTVDWLCAHASRLELAWVWSININYIARLDSPAAIRLLQKIGRSSEVANSQLTARSTIFADGRNEDLPRYANVLDASCKSDDLFMVRWFFEYFKVPFDYLIDGETILHKACIWSSASIVEYLITHGAEVNKAAADGEKPLGCLLKCEYGPFTSTPGIITALLEAGANINCLDKKNTSSLLRWAAYPYSNETHSQLQKILHIIVSSQPDLLHVNDAGETFWHVLAANRDGHRLSGILGATSLHDDTRAILDMADENGWTPLHVATSRAHGEMMQLLIALGSSATTRTRNGQTIVDLAVAVLDLSHVPFQIAFDAVCHTSECFHEFFSGDTLPEPVMTLVDTGDIHRLEGFVAAGGNLRQRFRQCDCTPITNALMTRQVALVEYLLSLGVKLVTVFCRHHFRHGLSTLGLLASQHQMFKQFQSIFDSVEDFTVNDYSDMIHSAAANGNLEALRLVLAEKRKVGSVRSGRYRDVLVYLVDQNEWMWTTGTPLYTAVRSGRCESLQILLTDGFDPDALDSAIFPCSHYATQQGDDTMLELLWSHGATIDSRDGNMVTTIGAAVRSGHLQIVHLLIQRGADLSVRDNRNCSLFQIASENGEPAIFFALLGAGLEPTLEDIYAWFDIGQRQVWMARDHMEQLLVMPEYLVPSTNLFEARAVFTVVPPHLCKLNLTCRTKFFDVYITALYRAAANGRLESFKLLHAAGAMLNLEGGTEGTPLMVACKAGRLDVVRYLVRNGAILSYKKHDSWVNAFDKASSYPKILRWLLVERFTEQRTIAGGDCGVTQESDLQEEDTYTYSDEIADVTLDLVLEDDVEAYLESKNWFLPTRRFIDNGKGAFERVPIMPEDFARYRPLGFKTSLP